MKPSKLQLANLPTPILKAETISKELKCNLFIKRDDYTGIEISGNKVRKLEYALKMALDLKCNRIITTGGIQSNHCRATTAAATKLGLSTTLLLRVNETPSIEGNYLLNKIYGAEIVYCTPDEYKTSRDEIMKKLAQEWESRGDRCFIIPEGASFGIGSMGYFSAMKEIAMQEREMGIIFNSIIVATGSGGTYSGLALANEYYNLNKRIVGFAVCDNTEYFTNRIDIINRESYEYLENPVEVPKDKIEIIDTYKGIGYALSTRDELDFIKFFARKESIILDPVYTAKAMLGLHTEISAGKFNKEGNTLFIHTGGLFGVFPKQSEFIF